MLSRFLPKLLRSLFTYTLACGAASVACAQAPAADDHVVSPFGISSAVYQLSKLPDWIPQMKAIGITDLRNPGGFWAGMETEPGKWAWEKFDKKIDYLESQGVMTGGLLYMTPDWAKKTPKDALPINSLNEWSNYVSQMVGRYKGRIKYWEVWNEPPNGTKDAPPADYAKTLAAAYKAAKAANPNCKVGLAAKSVHINYLDQVLLAGGKDHFDYVTLHPYEILGCVEEDPGNEAIYMQIVPTLRKMLAARNPAKANVPVWLTEIGYDARRGEERQADALVKAFTMGIAQGMECINWYEGKDGDDGPKGLVRADGTFRPSYTAIAQLIKQLGRYPDYVGWVLLNNKHYGFVFKGPNGPVLSTWAATTTPDTVDFKRELEILDPKTGATSKASTYALTTSPILVLDVPDSVVAQAQSNRNKPFPWGGDYSNAREVSILLWQNREEKGLHLLNGDAIGARVVAYGGNARAGDVPGGTAFVVDPNFLSYTKTPIEISMVVRRDESNAPAKVVLEYESTAGYKKAAPFEIPEGEKWSTATWQIDDPQFVNTWAFSFRVNQGKYLLQKVTARKKG